MKIFNNHKFLYPIATLLFISLTFLVVILPAYLSQQNNKPLPSSKPLTEQEFKGKLVYIAEGCVACHSQQVRNVEMDKIFGSRPGMAADYANIGRTSIWQNTATLMGTERTGPDLTDVGNRQPSLEWNLIHLYNPRILVENSIMPSYKWLFIEKKTKSSTDVEVQIPKKYLTHQDFVLVASKKALDLVSYIQSLKQAPLPQNLKPLKFLYKKSINNSSSEDKSTQQAIDGKTLYINNCQSCHQANGQGLKGAFPPLAGSTVVNGDNLELYVDIIMNGYDARPDYGVMSPIGTNLGFNEFDVAALINFERSSWNNNGKKVSPEEIKKILDLIKLKTQ